MTFMAILHTECVMARPADEHWAEAPPMMKHTWSLRTLHGPPYATGRCLNHGLAHRISLRRPHMGNNILSSDQIRHLTKFKSPPGLSAGVTNRPHLSGSCTPPSPLITIRSRPPPPRRWRLPAPPARSAPCVTDAASSCGHRATLGIWTHRVRICPINTRHNSYTDCPCPLAQSRSPLVAHARARKPCTPIIPSLSPPTHTPRSAWT